jgi:hypothetical protein
MARGVVMPGDLFSDTRAIVAVVLAVLGVLVVLLVLWRARVEGAVLVPVARRALTDPLRVIVPARNEEARIGPTLRALLREPSPLLRVLVVDDRSTDGTADVVKALMRTDARLSLLHLDADPPAGVFGKPRALALAVAHVNPAPDDVLVFLDADVLLDEGALGGVHHALVDSGADAFSGGPRLVCGSITEDLVVPSFVAWVAAAHPPSRVHRDDDKTALLNGQLIALRAETLASVGGFACVEHTVLEDVALGHALKSSGKRLRLGDLRTIAQTRMYTSWGELVAGFGKNARALLGPSALPIAMLSLVLSSLAPAGVLLALTSSSTGVVGLTLALFMLTTALQVRLRRVLQAPVWPALVPTLVYLLIVTVVVRALWHAHVRGHVHWRGRSYPSSSSRS